MYFYGLHACIAALRNNKRVVEKIYLTADRLAEDSILKNLIPSHQKVEILTKEAMSKLLPPNAVHQGICLKVQPLDLMDLSDFLHNDAPNQILLALDQVTDPQNIGAVLRSSAVFGASGLILTDRHTPKETSIIAKSASGALDVTPLCIVKNLCSALKDLKKAGFWCVGFAEKAEQSISDLNLKGKVVLVLGAEGHGLRRLTIEHCDFLARFNTASTFTTLNVSNAAAIALYETFQQQRG